LCGSFRERKCNCGGKGYLEIIAGSRKLEHTVLEKRFIESVTFMEEKHGSE
jgi:hypothetical protein